MQEPVCIAVIHFVLAFLHLVKFNEMSLVQELQFHYAESTLYTSAIHVSQCVLSLPYLQCATSLHLLTSLHRVHVLT